jgi:hypothetical protein
MHTRPAPGIHGGLAEELRDSFTSTATPAFEIEAAFASFVGEISHAGLLATYPPQPNEVYDFDELRKVDQGGEVEVGDLGDGNRSHLGSKAEGAWSVEDIPTLTGVNLN